MSKERVNMVPEQRMQEHAGFSVDPFSWFLLGLALVVYLLLGT